MFKSLGDGHRTISPSSQMSTLRLQGPPGWRRPAFWAAVWAARPHCGVCSHPLPMCEETPHAAARSPQQAGDPAPLGGAGPTPRPCSRKGTGPGRWTAPGQSSPQRGGRPVWRGPRLPRPRPCLQALVAGDWSTAAPAPGRPASSGLQAGWDGPHLRRCPGAPGRASCPAAHPTLPLPQQSAPTGPPTPSTWLFACTKD